MSKSKSQDRAAKLVFADGHIPDETDVKVNKHRDQIEYTKSMPNFLQQMKNQALARRGITVEQDLEHAKEIQKFTMHTVDDKRKHLESYEEPTSAKAVAAAADQAQNDADFEDEAFQRALKEMQQSSKTTKPTKANAAAAGATMGAARPIKRARADEEQTKDKGDKPKSTSAQPSKRNTMTLSFAVEDDDDE